MGNNFTRHTIHNALSQNMSHLQANSIELVVTSPPYPMIEMWDEIMSLQNPQIREALDTKDGNAAFELMHKELDKVWSEVSRVVIPGGIVCINIGDATRSLNGSFALYPNHMRIINYFINNGFVNLPNILWRKQTNAPNKFMGSGMLPAGAYVTLEHEWILIFRKGGKREFKQEHQKALRRESAFFWEERNIWFSDLWESVKGTKQRVANPNSRLRSAAYPFEIPYRLINMYSLIGDTVLDPFSGTGTTALAAMNSGRNSIGYDIDENFANLAIDNLATASTNELNSLTISRIDTHKEFVVERISQGKELKHYNATLGTPVMTTQEVEIKFQYLTKVTQEHNEITAAYSDTPPTKLTYHTKRTRKKSNTTNSNLVLFS